MISAAPAAPTTPIRVRHLADAAPTQPQSDGAADQAASQRIGATLKLLNEALAPQRRVVHAGDVIYQAGERFGNLYSCDAIAMDTGEVWTIRYDALLDVCSKHPALLTALHEAMSQEIGRDRDSLMSVCTLPADARVADFLRYWVESLARRGLRTDQITLRMTRAEIGNYLGMTLESVSRALSKLARGNVIAFAEKGRRDVQIPDVRALSIFVQQCLAPVPTLQ